MMIYWEQKKYIYYNLDLIKINLTELTLAHDTTDSGSVSYIKIYFEL